MSVISPFKKKGEMLHNNELLARVRCAPGVGAIYIHININT